MFSQLFSVDAAPPLVDVALLKAVAVSLRYLRPSCRKKCVTGISQDPHAICRSRRDHDPAASHMQASLPKLSRPGSDDKVSTTPARQTKKVPPQPLHNQSCRGIMHASQCQTVAGRKQWKNEQSPDRVQPSRTPAHLPTYRTRAVRMSAAKVGQHTLINSILEMYCWLGTYYAWGFEAHAVTACLAGTADFPSGQALFFLGKLGFALFTLRSRERQAVHSTEKSGKHDGEMHGGWLFVSRFLLVCSCFVRLTWSLV